MIKRFWLQEFRKAVDAWRSGNKTSNQIDDVGAKGTNSGETSTQITQQVSSAERLAKELEKEQLVAAEKMEQQRQEAELRLLKVS